MLQKLKKKSEGFTIIEVMIVLAIAALILVVVLIAVPQLQRNQRNANRRDVLGRMKTEVDNFAGNNNGSVPVANTASGQLNIGAPGVALGYFNRYLGCTAGTPPTCTVDINDPQTGQPVGQGNNNGAITTTAGAGAAVAVGTIPGSLAYATGAICNGESLQAGSTRQYAMMMRLEGGAIFCLDNR